MEIRTPANQNEWEEYYDLRYRILRQPWQQPRGSERTKEDALAVHLAYFDRGKIKGIVRLDTFENDVLAQIRFMAVDTNLQGRGIGKKLMTEAERFARQLGFSKMMLQARANALPFYESLGYTLIEKSHLLFGEIQHFRMEKSLNTKSATDN